MTHKEKRLAQIGIDELMKDTLSGHDSITIDIDTHGVKVRVWDKEHGNRKPVAFAHRMTFSAALDDIAKEVK